MSVRLRRFVERCGERAKRLDSGQGTRFICRLISVQPWTKIGSTMRAFSISYALRVLEFLSNRSNYVMVDGCRKKILNVMSGMLQSVFWACYCSSCTPRSIFLFWRISWSVFPMAPLCYLLCHPQAFNFKLQLQSY